MSHVHCNDRLDYIACYGVKEWGMQEGGAEEGK